MTPEPDFRSLALQAGLQNLLNGSRHFSICEFETLAQLANLTVPAQTMLELRALHCVSYSAMPAELHRQLMGRIMDMFAFALPAFEEKVVEPEPPTFFRRLLGGVKR